jgi:hypothetical protein
VPQKNDKDYAVVVGIDHYRSKSLNTLEGAINDAEAFYDWLVSEDGGNVPGGKDGNIAKLLSDDAGTSPRLDELQDEFIGLWLKSNKGKKRVGRRLYIFLAGHGASYGFDDICLLPANYSENAKRALNGRLIANIFVESAVFEEVLLFMDCCGDHIDDLNKEGISVTVDTGGAYKVKRCFGYATHFGRKAREKEFENGKHGVFTRALMLGLMGDGDKNAKTATTRALKLFVENKVKQIRDPNTEQEAYFNPYDDIVLDPASMQVEVIVKLSQGHRSFVVLDGHGLKKVENPVHKISDSEYSIELTRNKIYLFAIPSEQNADVLEKSIPVSLPGVSDEPAIVEL